MVNGLLLNFDMLRFVVIGYDVNVLIGAYICTYDIYIYISQVWYPQTQQKKQQQHVWYQKKKF